MLPEPFLYPNPLDKYAIGSRVRNLVYNPDGSLNLYLGDDGQPDLPSGGHAELPSGGQLDYLCDSGPLPAWTRNWTCSRPGERACGGGGWCLSW